MNGPASVTISGYEDDLSKVLAEFERTGVAFKKLVVSHAFHSAQMDGMLGEFEKVAQQIAFNRPKVKLISNLSGRVAGEEILSPAYWSKHVREAVRFADGVKTLHDEKFQTFLEIGPGTTLVGMARQSVNDDKAAWFTSLKNGKSDWQVLMESLGGLYVRGVKFDWKAFESDTPVRHKMQLPTYQFQRQRYWIEINRQTEPNATSASSARVPPTGVNLMYVPAWREAEAIPDVSPGSWLAIAAKRKQWEDLVGRPDMKFLSMDMCTNESALLQAMSTPGLSGILFLGDREAAQNPVDNKNCLSLLNVIKAAVSTPSLEKCKILVLTIESQKAVSDDRVAGYAEGTLWGMARVAFSEYPELNLRLVDAERATSAEKILAELNANADEVQVALRGGKRLAYRLERSKAEVSAPLELKKDSVYLVTGGLGGLGLESARWLARKGATQLALCGRSEPKAEALQVIEELRNQGVKVIICQGDIGKEADVRRFVAACEAEGGLRGIVHCAGVLHDATIPGQDAASFDKVMAPKVTGSFLLHELTRDLPLDFFLMFSSAAATLGAPGQANYAAANAFIDSLAYARSSAGKPTVSVNWGPWGEAGMASRMDAVELDRLAEAGFGQLSMVQGFGALDLVLGASGNIAIADINWDHLLTSPTISKFVRGIQALGTQNQSGAMAGNFDSEILKTLREAPEAERLPIMRRFLENEVRTLLSFDAKVEIDARKGLVDLGIDSLAAIEFRNGLKKHLGPTYGKSLPITLLFAYPTIEALADFLLGKVLTFSEMSAAAETSDVKPVKSHRALEIEPIAIVGMSCRFPGGASDLASFWELLSEGKSGFVDIPPGRWPVKGFYDPDPKAKDRSYTKTGGFLTDAAVQTFDPKFFGFLPVEAPAVDPQLRLLLEVSWEALENAGESPENLFGKRVGVYVGSCWNDYLDQAKSAGDLGDAELYAGALSSLSTLPGRLSYFFGFQGPAMQVDVACASSLLSTHLACESLRNGSSDVALASGVNVILNPKEFITLSRIGALSPTGQSLSFDAGANGYVRAEGCGVVVLKRLSDAVANGDRIYAVIRGSDVMHGGRAASPLAPNGHTQELLLKQAIVNAGVRPSEIGYIEAHGTGTPLGDPIEFRALANALKDAARTEPLMIASVKSNFGHAEGAAGIAGLIKAALAIWKGQIPPHLNLKKVNPAIQLEEVPAVIPTVLTPWKSKRKIAGVSSFGMSGVLAHMILEQAPESNEVVKSGAQERPGHVLCISAKDSAALKDLVARYLEYFSKEKNCNLADVCFTANAGRSHFEDRLSLVGASLDEIVNKLRSFSEGAFIAGMARGSAAAGASGLAVVFSSEEHCHLGMGQKLYASQAAFKGYLDECAKAANRHLEESILKAMFEDGELLKRPEYTRAAVFALEYSLFQLWKSWGIEPQAVTGSSVGETVAACVAGALGLEDAIGNVVKNETPSQVKRAKLKLIAGNGDPVKSLREENYQTYLEIGPGKADWPKILEALAALYVRGLKIDWRGFEQDAPQRHKVTLPTYQFQRRKFWIERKAHGDLAAPAPPAPAAQMPVRKSEFCAQLDRASSAGQLQLLNKFIATQVEAVLGVSLNSEEDMKRDFTSLGMDSLSVITLHKRINDGIAERVSVPQDALFTCSTGASLAQFIFEKLQEAAESAGAVVSKAENVTPLHAPDVGKWLRVRDSRPPAKMRLFCFHYAGGSAQIFDKWSEHFPEHIELCPIQLPGRWERINEAPFVKLDLAADAVCDAIKHKLDKPFAVLGYSLGALLSYQFLLRLRERKMPMPIGYFPAACNGPSRIARIEHHPISHLGDQELLEKFQQRYNGVPEELLKNEELRKIFLPIMRADIALLESYVPRNVAKFDFPIMAFGGKQDVSIPVEGIEAWLDSTNAPAGTHIFEGGHFFLQVNAGKDVIREIVKRLEEWMKLGDLKLKAGG